LNHQKRKRNIMSKKKEMVQLNVGGEIFVTSRTTLLQSGNRYFTRLLEEEKDGLRMTGSLRDNRNCIFIDRDADEFVHILKYLRGTLNLKTLTEQEKESLLTSATYFQVNPLIAKIEDRAYNVEYLSPRDQQIRKETNWYRTQLQQLHPSTEIIQTADKKFLIDLFPSSGRQYSVPYNLNRTLGLDDRNYTMLFAHTAGKVRNDMRKRHNWAEESGTLEALEPTSTETFKKKLYEFAGPFLKNLPMENLVLAGGAVLAVLQEVPEHYAQLGSDLDLFIKAENLVTAKQTYTNLLAYLLAEHRNTRFQDLLVVRTTNAITFAFGHPQRHIQLILRRYRNVADILLGFDVDCCQVAFDGEKVLATPAALRAINTGINIVDPERGTRKYEERLTKYAKRGYMVAVPGLDLRRVRKELLGDNLFTYHNGHMKRVCFDRLYVGDSKSKSGRKRRADVKIVVEPEPIQNLSKLIVLSRSYEKEGSQYVRDIIKDSLLANVTSAPLAGLQDPNFLIRLDRVGQMNVNPNAPWQLEYPTLAPPEEVVIDPGSFGTNQEDTCGGPLLPFRKTHKTAKDLLDRLEVLLLEHGLQGSLWVVYDYIEHLGGIQTIRTPCVNDAYFGNRQFVFTEDRSIPRHLTFPPSSDFTSHPWPTPPNLESEWSRNVYE